MDPFTFQPLLGGLELTPLRAYAHQVPHYYTQRFGSSTSHPNGNDYAAFAQDTMRLTDHLALSLGVRYDVQTFSRKYLKTNPLWPDSGKVPFDANNLAPRAGISYAFGNDHPLVFGHQFGAGRFVVDCTSLYERRLAAIDVKPTDDAGVLH